MPIVFPFYSCQSFLLWKLKNQITDTAHSELEDYVLNANSNNELSSKMSRSERYVFLSSKRQDDFDYSIQVTCK